MLDNAIDRYLRNYAEPETELLTNFPLLRWQHCVVIPALDEAPAFLQTFFATFHHQPDNYMMVLVVNRSSDRTHSPNNANLIAGVETVFNQPLWRHQHLSLHCADNISVLLVDRSSRLTIPSKQGVGLARKIGCDIACALIEKANISSAWVYSSDADARLPENYFCHSNKQSQSSARVFEFTHQPDINTESEPSCHHATSLYEAHLRYFRDGLDYAGSPYAFFTLGSTLAVSAQHYCAARGFPKRPAGEDFYLLNKLAKLGDISFCPEVRLQIQSRESRRVPFGTGPAVERISNMLTNDQTYCTYNPKIFILLRRWLRSRETLWETSQKASAMPPLDCSELNAVAKAIKLNKFLNHAHHHARSREQFHKQFQQWFDAFLTLKFIHFFQTNGFPPVPLDKAIRELKQLPHD